MQDDVTAWVYQDEDSDELMLAVRVRAPIEKSGRPRWQDFTVSVAAIVGLLADLERRFGTTGQTP